jgi:hypothetical protein
MAQTSAARSEQDALLLCANQGVGPFDMYEMTPLDDFVESRIRANDRPQALNTIAASRLVTPHTRQDTAGLISSSDDNEPACGAWR